jgi:hypothetical protein
VDELEAPIERSTHSVELGWESTSTATASLSIDGTVVDVLTET